MLNREVSDVIELAILIIMIAFCVAVGANSVINDWDEIRNYNVNYKEKTATTKNSPSIKVYGAYDGRLSQNELLLMAQIQDYKATNENEIRYAQKSYKKEDSDDANKNKKDESNQSTGDFYDEQITSTYRERYQTIVNEIVTILKNDKKESGYVWTYDANRKHYVFQKK